MPILLSENVYPLSAEEEAQWNAAREAHPEPHGWKQIEFLSRDTAGQVRFSFSRYKSGYYETLKKEGKLPQADFDKWEGLV